MSNFLRNALGAVFAVGLIGTGFELILLEHTEEFWQWSPIVLIGVALAMGAAAHLAPNPGLIKAFRGLMVLMVLSAAIGVWQHYAGNAEFELELYPSRAGFELFWESLKGATPALAPGMMMHLGLIGLAYTFKHPVFEETA